jgi:hypothetical protein
MDRKQKVLYDSICAFLTDYLIDKMVGLNGY